MIILISFLALWLLIGFIASGFFYAAFQRRYPEKAEEFRQQDRNNALKFILLGPLFFYAIWLQNDFQFGWLLPGRKP